MHLLTLPVGSVALVISSSCSRRKMSAEEHESTISPPWRARKGLSMQFKFSSHRFSTKSRCWAIKSEMNISSLILLCRNTPLRFSVWSTHKASLDESSFMTSAYFCAAHTNPCVSTHYLTRNLLLRFTNPKLGLSQPAHWMWLCSILGSTVSSTITLLKSNVKRWNPAIGLLKKISATHLCNTSSRAKSLRNKLSVKGSRHYDLNIL